MRSSAWHWMVTAMDSRAAIGCSGDSEADAFFRLFGDSDGDRDVDNLDFARLRGTYNKPSERPGVSGVLQLQRRWRGRCAGPGGLPSPTSHPARSARARRSRLDRAGADGQPDDDRRRGHGADRSVCGRSGRHQRDDRRWHACTGRRAGQGHRPGRPEHQPRGEHRAAARGSPETASVQDVRVAKECSPTPASSPTLRVGCLEDTTVPTLESRAANGTGETEPIRQTSALPPTSRGA